MRHRFKTISASIVLLIFNLLVGSIAVTVFWLGDDLLPGLRFERPWLAPLLLFVPLFSGFFIYGLGRKNKRLKCIESSEIRMVIFPDISSTRLTFKWLITMTGMIMLLLAAMDPQLGSKLIEVKTQGSDIMIALDVSHSMMAEDVSPNRLESAKRAIDKLIGRLTGDRIGIVVFAGTASIQLPITADYEAAKLFLANIGTDQIAMQGTDIGAAVSLCPDAFDPKSPTGKTIIVITDGEDHEGSGADAASEAAAKGITVHTIGVGSDRGAPIPVYEGSRKTERFKKDKNGNVVVSAMDEASLINIADNGNGLFTRSSGNFVDFTEILDQISKMQKDEKDEKTYGEYEHYFAPFAWAALLLLLLEISISPKRKSWSTSLGILD